MLWSLRHRQPVGQGRILDFELFFSFITQVYDCSVRSVSWFLPKRRFRMRTLLCNCALGRISQGFVRLNATENPIFSTLISELLFSIVTAWYFFFAISEIWPAS